MQEKGVKVNSISFNAEDRGNHPKRLKEQERLRLEAK